MLNLEELYQETILEHGQNPRNFGRIKKANYWAESFNPLCGDHYWIYLKISKNMIKDISFEGEGCLISKASASLMTEIVKDKRIKEAEKTFRFFQQLVTGKQLKEKRLLAKLSAFARLYKFPMRIECALLPWQALRKKF